MFGGGAGVVGGGSFCGDWGVFALVMNFKEVITVLKDTGQTQS